MGKIYLAGKLNEGEGSIEAVATELEERGHEITFKWWDSSEPKLPTPYLDHMETSQQAADAMEAASTSCDYSGYSVSPAKNSWSYGRILHCGG